MSLLGKVATVAEMRTAVAEAQGQFWNPDEEKVCH
jgi:hypothetical protein